MIKLFSGWLYTALILCLSMSGFAFFVLIAKFIIVSIKQGSIIFPLLYVVVTSLKLGFYIGVVITVGLWIKWRFNIK